MSRLDRAVPWAIAAVVVLTSPRLTGQISPFPENGRSFALSGADDTLRDALDRADAMLRIGELDIASVQEDTMLAGRVHERLGQLHRGIPVFGGQIARQMDGRSAISVNGRLYEGIDIDETPSISSEDARERAIAAAGSGARTSGDITLGVLPVAGAAYRLAYRMRVHNNWTIRDVYIDAHTGALAGSVNGIHSQSAIGVGTGVFGASKKMGTSRTSATFEAVDRWRPAPGFTLDFGGSLTRLDQFLATTTLFNSDVATDGDNTWTDGPTVDAHAYQGWVYDFYFKRFGRRGMDDRNIEVDSIVHPLARDQANRQPADFVGSYINNAFYCCNGILVYGDGDGRTFTYLAGGFDVVAHEWTHGVTDYSSQLIYRDEPGALNEAFSDIMAAAMEFYYLPVGSGPDRADWLIAEDVFLLAPGYLRSLNNPIAAGGPDHYSLRRFIGTSEDEGGIHFNVTIATHAFYLAVAGGRNRVSGITVPGVGLANIERMERIFYRAFVMLMTPNSMFSDARRATMQAAADLYGSGSNERSQVEQAWTAAGVN